MLKKLNLFFVLAVSLGFTRCAHTPTAPVLRELTVLEKSLVESDNKFGFNLFKKIVKAEPDTNIFISPLSVSMALGMTLNG
ncbi:MAG: serpin family protein, partial [bacterium]